MKKKWQDKFQISSANYKEWENSSRGESLAVWALKKNKISSSQYIEWATHHYRLPFLRESFFHNMSINQQLWNRVKNREQWNETFLPIYEWDNVLFAGCIKPPEHIQDKTIIPLLVLPKNLVFFWNKIEKFSSPEILYTKKNHPDKPVNKKEKTGFFSTPAMLLDTMVNLTITSHTKTGLEEQTYDQIFELSKNYFTGIIIFSFQDNEFTPVEWNDAMSGPTVPIKIKDPSIFKMIVTSRSPYHGFIVNNKVHKQFFTSWGFRELPKHITLIPLFDDSKKIVGAYMGIADKNIEKQTLYKLIKWTNLLPKALQKSDKQYKNTAIR